jgi:hypothetical protein
MNGSGEIYLAFDFRHLLVRRFTDREERSLLVELYDMGRPADAFGVFTRNRTAEEVGVGQGSEYLSGHLFFWKARYFVTVFAEQEFAAAKKAILEVGAAIAAQIGEEGSLPKLVGLLPGANLVQRSIRYFHQQADLNQHYFLSDQNIFRLGVETEAVLANYRIGDAVAYLLLVRYPGEAEADTAYQEYAQAYVPESIESVPLRLEDGSWTASIRAGVTIITVFDAPTEGDAKLLLDTALARVEGEKR